MSGRCAKQDVVAIIECGGRFYIGTNHCNNPQEECPRKGMSTGVGYDLCKEVCKQEHHAEVNACIKLGDKVEGAKMYIFGHTYCCKGCLEVMQRFGITEVGFVK